MQLEEAFARAEIIKNGNSTPKGSHTYMGFGWKIRNRYKSLILEKLDTLGYEEWNFSDLIGSDDFDIMNSSIMDISKKSMYIDDKTRCNSIYQRQIIAPTHEVPIYSWLREQIKYSSDLPLKFVHTGSAYRRPKKYPFPFALGERRSFIEAHGIYETSEQARAQINVVRSAIQSILSEENLGMPYIENERPLSTNNPVSKYTLCQDIILPDFGRTQIAGMLYFHDDIFAHPFKVRYKKPQQQSRISFTPSGLHFGFSDNLLLGTIVNSFDKRDLRFQLPDVLIPYHSVILVENGSPDKLIKDAIMKLEEIGLRYKIINVAGKSEKIKVYKKLNIQGTPIIIGINHNGRMSLNIGDIGENNADITVSDIPELSKRALDIRREKRRGEIQNTYIKTIIDGNNINIDSINYLLSEGKVVQIFMKQDDRIVIDFEKLLRHGEVLGFHHIETPGLCKHTGETVNSIASISKRF